MKRIALVFFLIGFVCSLVAQEEPPPFLKVPNIDWELQLPHEAMKADESIPGFRAEDLNLVLQVYELPQAWHETFDIFAESLVRGTRIVEQSARKEGFEGWYEVLKLESAENLQYFIAPWLTELPAHVHFMVFGTEERSIIAVGAYPSAMEEEMRPGFDRAYASLRELE